MPSIEKLDTHRKALTLNLDPSTFGSLDLQEWIKSFSASGWEWSATNGWVSAEQLRLAPPLGHLYAYLRAKNFLVPMQIPVAPPPASCRMGRLSMKREICDTDFGRSGLEVPLHFPEQEIEGFPHLRMETKIRESTTTVASA